MGGTASTSRSSPAAVRSRSTPGPRSCRTSSPSNSPTGHRCCSGRRHSASRAARRATGGALRPRRQPGRAVPRVGGRLRRSGEASATSPATCSMPRPPTPTRRVHAHGYPYSWLGVPAEVPPPCAELIHTHGEGGFALQRMRVRDELAARLAIDADRSPERGPGTAKSAPPARSRPRADAPRARCCSPGTPPAWCRRRAPRASTTRCPTFASRPARSSTRTKAERHNSSTTARSCASTGSGDRPASRTTRPGCRASGRRARLRPRSQDRPAAPDHCAPADGRRTGRPCTGLPSARRTGRLTDRSARPAPAARRRPCGPRPCPAHGPAR